MPETMSVQELIYNETAQITRQTDFGIGMQSVLSGAQEIPPEGARFDLGFEGELTGPKLRGKIAGTDYVLLRGDGVSKLHIHAVITTDDGERIAFYGDGVAMVQPGSSDMQVRENIALHTASPKYSWVNRLQIWAIGQGDLSTGKLTLKGYSA